MLALMLALLVAVTPASAAIVINEVESEGAADFVELYNTGASAVDIGNYTIDDDTDGGAFTIPPGTTIQPGGFYVTPNDPVGLGGNDSARLFDNAAAARDSYSWTSHAVNTYGRCPDGTGAFTPTNSATPGAANACPVAALAWPGGSAVAFADAANVFGANLSGLAYQPSGTGARGVLWAVQNNPPTLFRLVHTGTNWTPDTAGGWSTGKRLFYGDGAGVPDAEGVTLAGADANSLFVATERNDTGDGAPSRPAVLRYDVSSAAATLSATADWNLTADLPGLGANAGLEAVTWVPDEVLVAKGFLDEATGAAYDPATYPNHGSGLFFVGVEQDGRIVAYALDQSNGSSVTRVASIASGFPAIMALEYEAETKLLWAVCDNDCNGRHATLDVASGKFAVTKTYDRPAGMANLNNEGFAIAPQAECVDSLKPVIWADDGNSESHALRTGTLACTVPTTPPGPGTTTPPPVASPTPTPTPTPIASPTPGDRTAPVLSRVRATRKRVSFRISEAARVRITIARRSGRRYKRVKSFTTSVKAGARTVRFKGRVPASRLRRGRLRVTLVATDAAGNRSAIVRRRVR